MGPLIGQMHPYRNLGSCLGCRPRTGTSGNPSSPSFPTCKLSRREKRLPAGNQAGLLTALTVSCCWPASKRGEQAARCYWTLAFLLL